MYPDSPQEEQAFDPRSTARASIGNVAKQLNLMETAEQELTQLENLKQSLKFLYERLQPVIRDLPVDSVEGKMAEPNMNKLEGRLSLIIRSTREATQFVEQITREINL